ncbi:integrin beta L subunit precursor [Strongylocentrotus purpuratus]|uniref:Integrin beta n=1 Tax=Strongylocentrotus purpuratus TaxID=7668 RepID=A0A7M6UT54_STRPU|nr:integrin beta L subunit precursor [Strongylocentrotus purpuratus]|eukprot:XP_011671852.1 PREDICTED: integrin beta L subunit [Strongylocentrotus purpuratus]
MPSVRSPHRLNRLGSVVVFFLTFVLGVFTVHANEELSSICQGAQNCGECITVNPECTWCTEDTFQGRRCDLESRLQDAGCSNITNPLSSADATQDDPLSEANADLDEIVQVKPQRMKIKVRPNEPIDIRLYVRQAADYPVDLYYAMDLSNSMRDDLENLKGLGTTLSKVLSNITGDFRLGFGSFVDKRILPFVNTLPDRLIFPCPESSESCARTHGFFNALPLNEDSTLFANLIANTIISGNLDTPEGGFDALMQIAVCGNIIGWRPKARHLVIFTTDAPFHIAGDGRLGGLVEPNDGQCHTDPNTNMYTFSTLQDYPSIGHLSAKLRENNVIPIFAVTSRRTNLYMKLENYIEGATVGTLDVDSGNIVQLIQSNYDRITSQVRLTSTAPDDVTLSYRANCIDQTYEDTNECSGLKLEDTVSFDITITAERCVEGGMTSFEIGPVGFNEELKIELEVTCECDCQGLGEANSNVCSNGNGTLVCGECACNPGRYGVKCECSGNEISMESTDTSQCRTDNTTRTCSGRGECICGKCVCDNTGIPGEVISGQFCECDNFNCPYSRGLRCGGPDQGMCVCDVATRQPKCRCEPGFKGDSCDCPTRKDTCRASNGLECNARGTCECGVCECIEDSQFQGKTCERCTACPSGNCHIHRDCVQCTVFESGRLTPEQCGMCSIDIINVTSIDEYTKDNPICDFMLNGICTFRFVVVSENETVTVYVEGEPTCITPNPRKPRLTPTEIRWIIIGIILGIVLIGIILVCAWRLYINIQDRREYAQWKKESQKPKWAQGKSTIYLPPISRHENPLHIDNQK